MLLKGVKYFSIALIAFLLLALYWIFLTPHWGVIIGKGQKWEYAFQSKDETSYQNTQWNVQGKGQKISLPTDPKNQNLLFRSKFYLDDFTTIKEGILEYNYRYSCKVFINGVAYADIERGLITPTIKSKGKIAVYKNWTPRRVQFDPQFLQHHLKNGENTILLVLYKIEDLREIKTDKKQLSFLSSGKRYWLKKRFKLSKPTSYFSRSTLPIFKINTHGKVVLDEPKIQSSLEVINNSEGSNKLTDSARFYNIKIEHRGHTSQTFAKKSYGFNLYDENYKKKVQELLDLPKSERWVLNGPYADKSLIRNALTYSLYSQMGNYAPRVRFVDLVVNNNYQGIYMLIEKIQISQYHLNIPELKQAKSDSNELDGGYIIEVDRKGWKSDFPPKQDQSSHPINYSIHTTPRKIKNQRNIGEMIKSQFNVFEQHLYAGDSIYNYLDINSFVDYLIITEFTKNIDGYRLSTFLHNKNIANKTPKFYMGPIWDYNFSFGLADYNDGYNPEGYVYDRGNFVPFWWQVLLKDERFLKQLRSRYSELRTTTLSDQNVEETIDSLVTICKGSSKINFNKWDILGSSDFWPNYYLGETHEDEIAYLKDWITQRFIFLDEDILKKYDKTKDKNSTNGQ